MQTTDYVDLTGLKDTLSLTGETYADGDLQRAITAASRACDDFTHRRFWPDADATQVRYYSPTNDTVVYIDDLLALTELRTDPSGNGTFQDHWTEISDFYLEPLNAQADSEPWRSIRVSPRTALYLPVYYPRSVKVTGQFGWAAVPDQVEQAATMIATKLLKRVREAPFGVVAGFAHDVSVAVQVTRSDPDVQMLLNPLVRAWDF